MKIGDKAKVVDKESILYNKIVELIKVVNEAYIFYFEPQDLKLVVHKDDIQRTIKWESSPDKGEKNIDKLLGQNGELVEERKKQVLAGALGIVQRYCEETPNKMEVVAALFGKKLGKRFTIQFSDRKHEVMFTPAGLDVLDYNEFFADELGRMFLEDLLTGEAVIVDE